MKLLHDFGSCCSRSATAVAAPPPAEEKRSAAVVPLLEHYYRDGNGGSSCNKLSITRSASSSWAAHSWRPALSAISEESPVVSFAGDATRIVRKGAADRGTKPLQKKTASDRRGKSNSPAKPKSSSYCHLQRDNSASSSSSPMVMASFSPAPFMF
ncbi:unnamed protein product [Linum tenue]|uniref:Uncharacterized protein n=1 Tax=Linum tenue TaxID=586396 RepID=A0AAV0R147_9ROSI|nr:unnamed protein product [Linum tenue]CAI0550468.1 unnamed protein product [Linum tenue]